MNVEEKKEVLKMLEGQSTREAERTLESLSTQPVSMASVEQVKPLTKELSKISFLADEEFMDQLEEAKGLLASKMPGASVSEILAEVMKLGLSSLRKKRFKLKDDQVEATSGAGIKEQPQTQSPFQAKAESQTTAPAQSHTNQISTLKNLIQPLVSSEKSANLRNRYIPERI